MSRTEAPSTGPPASGPCSWPCACPWSCPSDTRRLLDLPCASDHDGSVATPSARSRLLWCGVVAGPLFVAVVVAQDLVTAGYDAQRLPISLHAVGDRGWVQTLNFLVDGALLLGFALGLRRTSVAMGRPAVVAPALVAVVGAGVIGAGLFATDPGGGFPPGVPPPDQASVHGTLHDLVSLVVFVSLPVMTLAIGRWLWRIGDRGWAASSVASAAVTIAGFACLVVGLNSGDPAIARVAGTVQRVVVGVGRSEERRVGKACGARGGGGQLVR